MKKLLFIAVLAVMALAGCKEDPVEPETTGPDPVPANIRVPDEASLTQTAYADQTAVTGSVKFVTAGAWTSTVTESTAKADTVTWLSISPNHGDTAGEYTINITLEPNTTGASRTATVTIACNSMDIGIAVTQKAANEDGSIPVSGVTLDSDTLYLNTGQTIQLTATVTPGDATNRAVTWQAAGDDATVDQTGTVTAVKAGEARVTVTTADGGFTYGCTVRVNTSQITFVARAANLPYLALAGNGETSEYQSPPWN